MAERRRKVVKTERTSVADPPQSNRPKGGYPKLKGDGLDIPLFLRRVAVTAREKQYLEQICAKT